MAGHGKTDRKLRLIGELSLFSMENSQRANKLFAGFSKCVCWNDPDGQKDMLFNPLDIGGIFKDLLYPNNPHVFGTLGITPEWTKPKLSLLLFITKPPRWLYWNRSSTQHSQLCQLNKIIIKFHNPWCFWPRTLEFWQVLPWLWSSWRGPQTNRSFKNFWALQSSNFHGNLRMPPPQGNEVWLRRLFDEGGYQLPWSLIRPYFLGGVGIATPPLDSHDVLVIHIPFCEIFQRISSF